MRFEILPGLPAYGPAAVSFDERGKYSEGLVVRFYPKQAEPWVANFSGRPTKYNAVLDHPDGADVIVVTGGGACIVDPETRKIRHRISGQVEQAIRVPSLGLIVVQCLTDFIAITSDNDGWRSERISWDGFRNIEIDGAELLGEAYTPIGDTWVPFKLDLLTGRCPDAIYQRDMARAVRVVPKAD
jgi:hypothetical protein